MREEMREPRLVEQRYFMRRYILLAKERSAEIGARVNSEIRKYYFLAEPFAVRHIQVYVREKRDFEKLLIEYDIFRR